MSDTFGVGEQVTTTGGDSGGGVDGRSGMLGSFGELLSTLNKLPMIFSQSATPTNKSFLFVKC